MKAVSRAAAPIACLALLACATTPLRDLRPGERPPLESDEAGLWMQMDRVEESLRTSGRTLNDADLGFHVRQIVCNLAPEHCATIRVYLVQTPHFNASMRPNGVMEVWTGLILRTQSEAQLAFVLAHEIAHFQRRHSLQAWRRARATADGLVFFQILTAAAGVGYVGSVAQLIALGSIFSFSRDQEREADRLAFELFTRAGYDPDEAPAIWDMLLAERAAADDPEQFIFFSNHPSDEERLDTLRRLAETEPAGITGRESFLEAMLPLRAHFLRDELRTHRYERSEFLLSRLLDRGAVPAEIEFFQGELHRLRGEDGDVDKAIEYYLSAAEYEGAPAETHRALGVVYRRTGEREKAAASFERYLEAAPNAADRLMIESYLRELD